MKKTFIIGVTGNFGTGKTQFCKFIEENGFPIIYSDLLAKKVIHTNEDLQTRLSKEFGKNTFMPDGSFNTKYISSIVFSNDDPAKKKLLKLNSIIHPLVIEELLKEIDKSVAQQQNLIFVESALIYEAELENAFDFIILVTSDKEKIVERIQNKTKMSKEEILARLDTQIDDKKKIELADFVVYNNSTLDDLKKNAILILELIQAYCNSENQNEK